MTSKEQAIQLRKQGYSYSYISAKTRLSKSTLSHHLSGIPFTPNAYTLKRIGNARSAAAQSKARKKKEMCSASASKASQKIRMLTDRDLFMLGLGLYIGEGSKTQYHVRLVNSDPKVVRLFIKWLYALGLSSKHITLRVHLYPESDVKAAEKYWLGETHLPHSCLQKASIDMRASKDRKRSGTHQFGTAHVTVRANGKKEFGVALSRDISAYMAEVLQ